MSIYTTDGDVRPGRIWSYGCLTAFLLLVVLPLALWAFGVFSASTKGTGDVRRDRGGAANREQWSATFTGLYGQLQADQQNIKLAAAAATGPASTKQDAVNLQGVQQNCDTDVGQWNSYLLNALAVVPDGYPQQQLDPSSICSTDSTRLITP
jgi:hypothetical protein